MYSFKPIRPLRTAALAACLLLTALLPARAAITTVHTCPSSGHGGNHDAIFNGFIISGVNATNLHTVQLYYTTDQNGSYSVSLTARRNSFAGPLVGTLSKNLSLTSTSDATVTWDFGDAPINSGDSLYFTHTFSGPSGVQFNLQPNQCPGNVETAGISTIENNFSVATTITTNTVTQNPSCVANATTLCIDDQSGDKRFQVRATYSTSQGGGLSGNGKPIALSSLGVNQGGLFWFFSANNPELLIKVLNACATNGRFWIFATAGTNVGFIVTVTDTKTNRVATYTNPDLTAAKPVQDTTGGLLCN